MLFSQWVVGVVHLHYSPPWALLPTVALTATLSTPPVINGLLCCEVPHLWWIRGSLAQPDPQDPFGLTGPTTEHGQTTAVVPTPFLMLQVFPRPLSPLMVGFHVGCPSVVALYKWIVSGIMIQTVLPQSPGSSLRHTMATTLMFWYSKHHITMSGVLPVRGCL